MVEKKTVKEYGEITIGIDKHGRHKLEMKAEATTEGVQDRMRATL